MITLQARFAIVQRESSFVVLRSGNMSNRLLSVHVRNYRSLADIKIDLKPINVLFGPNGAGKSSFLDTIWFVRDCAIRGVDLASSTRSHGIGLLYDGATEDEAIEIALVTQSAEYVLTFV